MNKRMFLSIVLTGVILTVILISCSQGPPSGRPDYPATKTVEVVDTLHGVPVADPYRWLEYTDSADVQTWTDEQNALTRSYLDKIPAREKIKTRLEKLWDYPIQSLVTKCKNRYFIEKNIGLRDQNILYTMDKPEGDFKVVIDPNAWSAEGTCAMDYWTASDDGDFIAYGKSCGGAERGVMHIFDVVNSRELPDTIPDCRYPSISWLKDNSGFFYNRHPARGSVTEGDESYYDKIYFHKLGDHYTQDKLYYDRIDIKELGYGCDLSKNDKYLIIYDFLGSSRTNELRLIDLEKGYAVKDIITGFKAFYSGIPLEDVLYIRTNEDTPNYKIMAIDLKKPQRKNWREVVPESEDFLEEFTIIDRKLVLHYLHNAHSQVVVYNLEGRQIWQVELPTLGSISKFSGRWDDKEMYFSFTSFTFPTTHCSYNIDSNRLSEFYRFPVKVDTEGYLTEQYWYESKDGTKISMFVVHKEGLKFDGSNPTYLTGYGGFTSNQVPYFSSSRFIWLENGGVYALPNLRGGAEYGEKWHRAGMLESKQNTFDDFIAAAEWLIEKRYTSPEKLVIEGGSNGGLLVGAAAVQRPELFKAVACGVPLLDMLRYHQFLMARYWVSEYGSSEDPDQFQYIYKYSPYHNVKKGVAYPAMLLTASETDSRVHPMHAAKMAAALQNTTSGDAPILTLIDRKIGHGWGTPTSLRIANIADEFAFLFWQVGMKVTVE